MKIDDLSTEELEVLAEHWGNQVRTWTLRESGTARSMRSVLMTRAATARLSQIEDALESQRRDDVDEPSVGDES
jgi:hypothetical protein